MSKLLFLVIWSITLLTNTSNGFAVNVEFLRPPDAESILIKVQVKNLSKGIIKVLKHRRHDYKWEKIRSFGNYIIEIEKWETDRYYLFSPTADIDPVFEKEEYISLKGGENITDRINITGYSFSRPTSPKPGFPVGSYRLRVSFNTDEWNSSQTNNSAWLSFKIE